MFSKMKTKNVNNNYDVKMWFTTIFLPADLFVLRGIYRTKEHQFQLLSLILARLSSFSLIVISFSIQNSVVFWSALIATQFSFSFKLFVFFCSLYLFVHSFGFNPLCICTGLGDRNHSRIIITEHRCVDVCSFRVLFGSTTFVALSVFELEKIHYLNTTSD